MDHDHDVIIAGGGLNGPTLALALAGAGLSVAVVDARPAPDRAAHGFDGRAYSLALAPEVSERGRFELIPEDWHEPLRQRLDPYPGLRFKLDPTSSWSEELIAELVATEAVDSVDFKGHYTGTVVDQPPDPVLYGRVVEHVNVSAEEFQRVLVRLARRQSPDSP